MKDLLIESGAHASWTVSWEPEGVSTAEPARESLRSWLLAVRDLDVPNRDLYLPSVMNDLEVLSSSSVTHQRLAVLRVRHARLGVSSLGHVIGEDGPMSPRDCFEDLAYTDHLHRDREREARRAAMPPFIWEMVRMIGWDYAGEVADIATWLQATGREDAEAGLLFDQDQD